MASNYSDCDYDPYVAQNISPEPLSDDGMSTQGKGPDNEREASVDSDSIIYDHPSDAGDHDDRFDHEEYRQAIQASKRKRTDRSTYSVGAARAQTEANSTDEDGEKWFEKPFLSYFEFPPELQKSKPKPNDNIRGKCKRCRKPRSGRIASTSNWVNHLEVCMLRIKSFLYVNS